MPVYFCWLCEAEVQSRSYSDQHYENGRMLYFCGPEHAQAHAELKAL